MLFRCLHLQIGWLHMRLVGPHKGRMQVHTPCHGGASWSSCRPYKAHSQHTSWTQFTVYTGWKQRGKASCVDNRSPQKQSWKETVYPLKLAGWRCQFVPHFVNIAARLSGVTEPERTTTVPSPGLKSKHRHHQCSSPALRIPDPQSPPCYSTCWCYLCVASSILIGQ